MDLGQGPFGLTANHVITDALAPETVKRGLFPIQFEPPAQHLFELPDLEDRIIIRDAEKDIATFRVTNAEVTALHVSVITLNPVVPTAGVSAIGFTGFPGQQRLVLGVDGSNSQPELELSSSPLPAFGIATAVNDRQITYQFEREHMVVPPGFTSLPSDFRLGGMSGGPLFVRFNSPVERLAPAGIIVQGDMLPHHDTGLLFASRLDGLRPDGRFG